MAEQIHPTAIIDKNAIIHDGVEVGAYAVIGPHVEIGANSTVGNHANITGHTKIGKNNKIFCFASIGEAPQHKKYEGEATRLEIGDDNVIREFCTIHVGTTQGHGVTHIGENNFLMAYVHIAHDCVVGNNTTFANSVALGGHVVVKDFATLGAYSIVHQFGIIGDHTMLGGATGAAQDIPPYIMAMGYRAKPRGINSEGLKRRGFTPEQIENIKNAYRILYRQGLFYAEAKEQIIALSETQLELKPFVNFFQESTRGIIRESE